MSHLGGVSPNKRKRFDFPGPTSPKQKRRMSGATKEVGRRWNLKAFRGKTLDTAKNNACSNLVKGSPSGFYFISETVTPKAELGNRHSHFLNVAEITDGLTFTNKAHQFTCKGCGKRFTATKYCFYKCYGYIKMRYLKGEDDWGKVHTVDIDTGKFDFVMYHSRDIPEGETIFVSALDSRFRAQDADFEKAKRRIAAEHEATSQPKRNFAAEMDSIRQAHGLYGKMIDSVNEQIDKLDDEILKALYKNMETKDLQNTRDEMDVLRDKWQDFSQCIAKCDMPDGLTNDSLDCAIESLQLLKEQTETCFNYCDTG